MSDKETSFKKFKGEILYVKTKSLLRKLVQKLFLKLLSILSGNKFLKILKPKKIDFFLMDGSLLWLANAERLTLHEARSTAHGQQNAP
jgi:hypothetical protein